MTATAASRRLHGASMVLIGLAVALVLLDITVALSIGGADPVVFGVLMLAYLGMTVAGAVLIRDARHAGLGRLLLGVAATGAVYNLCGWLREGGPFGFLEGVVYWGYAGLLTHLAVRWPDDRIGSRTAKALVVAMYAVMPALTLLWQLTWDARWFEGGAGAGWWLTLAPARGFSSGTWQVQQLLFIALIAALVAVVVARVVGARGPRRAAMLPVAVVAVGLAAVVVVEVLGALGVVIPVDPGLLQSVALLAIPVAVLIAAAREPAVAEDSAMPGRRRLDEHARERYRFGLAGAGAALVVVVAVLGVAGTSGSTDDPQQPAGPAPQPGPALVEPQSD